MILDMDGLVLDTEKTYRIAWQKACEQMGFELEQAMWRSFAGLPNPKVEAKLIAVCGPDFQLDQFRRLSSEHWHHYVNNNGIPVKTGFHKLMQTIATLNISYCLATNSLQKNAEHCLELAEIRHCFPLLVTRDQVRNAKPAPDIFIRAAVLLQQPVVRCLVVEDSKTGIEAACSAGAISILIPEQTMVADEEDGLHYHRLQDLNELAAVISSNFNRA